MRASGLVSMLAVLVATSCSGGPGDTGASGGDDKGPVPGEVRDGSGDDIDSQLSRTELAANWSHFTDDSGIAFYEIAVGSSPGATDVQAWKNVGAVSSTSISGLALRLGQRYYFSVRATDNLQNTGSPATSDGVKISDPTEQDTTPPFVGVVRDGLGADVDEQTSLVELSANWSGFRDDESGIDFYEIAIGTGPGLSNVVAWINIGNVQSLRIPNLSLVKNQTYFASVRATNKASLASYHVASDGVRVIESSSDTTPPSPGTVNDGAGVDVDVQASTTDLEANWSGFKDDMSGIDFYEVAFGTTRGGADVRGWANVGLQTSARASGLSLQNAKTYYASVRATDKARNLGVAASSDGVTVTSQKSSRLSQFGITWTLAGEHTTGRFANGDMWVVGPVQIIDIDPPSTPDMQEQIVDGMGSSSGMFTLTFNGQTTGSIAQNATAATVESIIEQLPNVADVQVVKTWQPQNPQWSVKFVNWQGPLSLMVPNRGTLNAGRLVVNPRARNGSMVNPVAIYDLYQGYETACNGLGYKASLNVAAGVSPSTPLTLPPGSSLVSMISADPPFSRPALRVSAVLTVLASVPPDGSFRPPYCGSDKTVRFRESSLRRDKLLNLTAAAGMPALSVVERYFERPWIDHIYEWMGEAISQSDNMVHYGRDLSTRVGLGSLMLNCQGIDKSRLLTYMVQKGIDYYGVVEAGGNRMWLPNGGYATGRKWLILMAGLMLDDPGMAGIGSRQVAFGEDGQTFFVEETSPGKFNYGYGGYDSSHKGMAEWGGSHSLYPQYDTVSWTSNSYRLQGTANAWSGMVLAARMMGAQSLWKHDALFGYQDRYMTIMKDPKWPRDQYSYHPFMGAMWDMYRPQF